MDPVTRPPDSPAAPLRIVRAPKDSAHPYARLGNAILTPGPTLPLDSRSVLAYLLSLPDTWHLRLSHLRRVLGCGRDKLQRMIRDLEAAGHLVRRRIHQADGRWFWDSTLYEQPVAGALGGVDAAAPAVVAAAAPAPAVVATAAPAPPVGPVAPAPAAPPLPPSPVPVGPVPPRPALQEQRTQATTHPNKGDDSNPHPIAQNPEPPPYSAYIAGVVLDHSRELGDGGHAPANITQALRLAQAAGCGEPAFVDALHTARARTRAYQGKQGTGQITRKMAYYFAVLRDLVGLAAGIVDSN